tara:strand:- start:1408 stop:1974 length:567 start_codon:yes stop_codon:yes gene_type:complete
MNNQRYIALIILLTPLLVLGLSTAFFYSGLFSASNTTENGYFLEPENQIGAEDTQLKNPDGSTFKFIKGKWYLIYFDDFNNEELSYERYDIARAINITLGRESNRLKRVVIYQDEEKFKKAKKLTEDFPNVFFVFDNENLYLKKIEKEIENPYSSKSFLILNYYSDLVGEFDITLTFDEVFEDVKKLL